MTLKDLQNKIKSVRLCLEAHPDNEPNSEFEDKINDMLEIEIAIVQEAFDLADVSQQRELFEIIADRLQSELGAELSRLPKEDLIKIISNGG